MLKRIGLFTTFLLVLLLVGAAWAQDATPEATAAQKQALTYGTPVTGTIDNTVTQQSWTLSVASGDRIMVQVQRTSGNLVPDVMIQDSSGNDVVHSYGADRTYAAATIDDSTLPAAGDYVVIVTRENGDSGTTTGGYTLTVTPLGTAPDNPNNQTVISEIMPDTPISGEITAAHWYDMYTYNALAGDSIDVMAQRTGGTLEPVVDILDSNGNSLRKGYNSGTMADSGEFDLPAPGQYTIVVSRNNDQSGDTVGTYDVTLHLVGSGEGSPNLQGTVGTVTYDQPLDGQISGVQWYQDWTLTATAGDELSLTVTRKDGDLEPEVILLGGSGQELNHAYTDNTGAAANIDHYTLAGPGSYSVRVSRKSGQTGLTSGNYTLMVALDGAGKGSPNMKDATGEVTLGTPVNGEVTNARWADAWTFTSDGKTPVDITVTRTDGTLVPTIEIHDANDQVLTYSNNADTHDSATISNYTPPTAATYRIVVIRQSGQDGYTSGKYTLSVSASAK